jgi:predicted GTPase
MDTAGIDGIRLKHSIGREKKNKSNLVVSSSILTTTTTSSSLPQILGTNDKDSSSQILETNPYNTTFKSHQRLLNTKQDDNPWVMSQMMQQTLEAAQNSHAILLVMDARVGITSDWMEISKWLRRNHHHRSHHQHDDDDDDSNQGQQHHIPNKHKVIVIANKLEGDAWNYDDSPVWEHIWELENAGFGKPIAISALHGEGMADLAIALMELQTKWKEQYSNHDDNEQDQDDDDDIDNDDDEDRNDGEEEVATTIKEKPLQLAILGRQNVGKVSYVFVS